MFLFIDTETTGIPKSFNEPYTNIVNWPRLVQIGYILTDRDGNIKESNDMIVFPDDFEIPFESEQIHNISTQRAKDEGIVLNDVLDELEKVLCMAVYLIGHNLNFDKNVIASEMHRMRRETCIHDLVTFCTMKSSVKYCNIKNKKGLKYPTLEELHTIVLDND